MTSSLLQASVASAFRCVIAFVAIGFALAPRAMAESFVPRTDFTQVSTGAAAAHGNALACATTSTGAAVCWGDNRTGVLGTGGSDLATVPIGVRGLEQGGRRVEAGSGIACANRTNGALMCWGLNNEGLLGNGTLQASSTPVAVSGLGAGVQSVLGRWACMPSRLRRVVR